MGRGCEDVCPRQPSFPLRPPCATGRGVLSRPSCTSLDTSTKAQLFCHAPRDNWPAGAVQAKQTFVDAFRYVENLKIQK